MVAAAFESLLTNDEKLPDSTAKKFGSKSDEIDERIVNAKTVLGLLSVAENSPGITRKHALKVGIA